MSVSCQIADVAPSHSITSSARATNAAGPCRELDELFSQAAKTGAIGKARKAA
jgi:hypothetical protein